MNPEAAQKAKTALKYKAEPAELRDALDELRACKTEGELALMRTAADVSSRGHVEVVMLRVSDRDIRPAALCDVLLQTTQCVVECAGHGCRQQQGIHHIGGRIVPGELQCLVIPAYSTWQGRRHHRDPMPTNCSR